MKFFLFAAIVCLIGLVSADLFEQTDLESSWLKFKSDFNRVYQSENEEASRKSIFAQNREFIIQHNGKFARGESSFMVGVNQFADMTNEEFRRSQNGFKMNLQKDFSSNYQNDEVHVENLPNEVDWTKKGVVTPIKNQGQCGSCWAFSTVASIEGQHALKTGKLVSLSEQQLVDCSRAEGNMGCEGGLMDDGFKYVIINHGLDTEQSYSYKAIDEKCHFNKRTVGATITSYVDVTHNSEAALKKAVAEVGPISVAIDASSLEFQLYTSGIYNVPSCSSTSLDHGVTAVGYGTLNGTDYWKVKNSWGTSWGMKGYVLMSRNKNNQCGIATMASYPVV